jgi:hypothetical protein
MRETHRLGASGERRSPERLARSLGKAPTSRLHGRALFLLDGPNAAQCAAGAQMPIDAPRPTRTVGSTSSMTSADGTGRWLTAPLKRVQVINPVPANHSSHWRAERGPLASRAIALTRAASDGTPRAIEWTHGAIDWTHRAIVLTQGARRRAARANAFCL